MLFTCFLVAVLLDMVSALLTPREKASLVAIHNRLRRDFASLSPPPCSPLNEMTWNERLASLAQAESRKCVHDLYGRQHHKQVTVFGKTFHHIGENSGLIQLSRGKAMDTVISTLFNTEYRHYNYTSGSCGRSTCKHYTQLIWNASTFLGCGASLCPHVRLSGDLSKSFPWNSTLLVCFYTPGGNIQTSSGHLERPYKTCQESSPSKHHAATTSPASSMFAASTTSSRGTAVPAPIPTNAPTADIKKATSRCEHLPRKRCEGNMKRACRFEAECFKKGKLVFLRGRKQRRVMSSEKRAEKQCASNGLRYESRCVLYSRICRGKVKMCTRKVSNRCCKKTIARPNIPSMIRRTTTAMPDQCKGLLGGKSRCEAKSRGLCGRWMMNCLSFVRGPNSPVSPLRLPRPFCTSDRRNHTTECNALRHICLYNRCVKTVPLHCCSQT